MWDKRLTEKFCDICIKEILKGNRPGTHFTKDGWLKIMTNFKKETGKSFSQRQLKNRWDALKKEWKAWKKLKGEDTGLGWNLIKRTVDASDDWWERKLDQMFMGIVATGDKPWAPSSGTFRTDFFEDVTNEIPEENEEENMRNDVHILNDVHISNDVQIDGNADNMSQATSSLTLVMDPYGIPQAVKMMSIVENYSGDENDDEREKKDILQRMECFNRLFVAASSSVQLYYEKYILRQPCMDSKQSGETWIREILDDHESRCMVNFRMSKMDCIGAIDGTHIAAILPPNEQIPYIGRKGYLGPYKGQRYHLPEFRRGRPVSGKEKKKWVILRDMPSYCFEKQTMIVVVTMTIHNFIRKHVGRNDADFMEYEDIN
ncbi:hypothetical protein GOBAR_DD01287 [Gossypium barbadense]|nr:hypothetical protein GOBAR_DD01287 [Gossypium barbadense]